MASDRKSVIQDIKANMGGAHAAVIKEVNDRKKKDLQDCCFIHESIHRNYEADSLAKFSSSLDFSRHVWFGVSHDIITIPLNFIE